MQNEHNINNKQNETDFSVENNLPKNFSVNATKGAQVLALVFVIGAAVFTNGDQTAIAANASVQPHSGILISTPPPPPPTHNLKARKGAYIAGEGHSRANSFADFYKQRQIELLSALDNALSQKAQDTLTEFAAVKKADIQLQTQLGNRKGQIAANIIGAFAESQNSAFGWQVRVFGAENDTKGANAGIFFRRLDGETLYGINSFADYEDGDYGEFLRYGIGGELQNRHLAFAMNYYFPITDDREQGATVAFSQKGYDANLRINIPQLDFLKVAADYYLFDGKYGGEDDKGFRYGLELQPISNLRIGAFYDDGGEKFGGDIVYVYNFGIPQKRESTDFAPDLFSPVLREYSQRIISTTTLQIVEVPTLTLFTTTTIPARVQRTTLGLGFMTVSMPITVATATITDSTTMMGMTTTTEIINRIASINFTVREDYTDGSYILASSRIKILATLPPADALRPYVLTLMQDLGANAPATPPAVIISSSNPDAVGNSSYYDSNRGVSSHTITIVEGSEDFTGGMITTEITSMTVLHIITETMMTLSAAMTTRMTNTLMPTLTITMTISAMMITTPTLTLYQTITAGIPTIGAANVDSHFPPSFPPLSFPPLSPIMVSYGLAKNGDSWIPAMVIPAFAPFPRHSRVCVAGAGIQHTNAAACGGKGANAPLI